MVQGLTTRGLCLVWLCVHGYLTDCFVQTIVCGTFWSNPLHYPGKGLEQTGPIRREHTNYIMDLIQLDCDIIFSTFRYKVQVSDSVASSWPDEKRKHHIFQRRLPVEISLLCSLSLMVFSALNTLSSLKCFSYLLFHKLIDIPVS